MTFDNERAPKPNETEPHRISAAWDIYVPISVAATPAGIFAVLRLVTEGLDKPNAEPSTSVIVAMMILQTLGMIAMATVILIRFDTGMKRLSTRTDGRPPVWRKLTLVLSLMFMLLFDVLTNTAAWLAGAELLLIPAVPAFIFYLVCVRVAHAGLSTAKDCRDSL